jgi:hypothetical protein
VYEASGYGGFVPKPAQPATKNTPKRSVTSPAPAKTATASSSKGAAFVALEQAQQAYRAGKWREVEREAARVVALAPVTPKPDGKASAVPGLDTYLRVATDKSGNLYVLNATVCRVQVFSPKGTLLSKFRASHPRVQCGPLRS